LLYIKNPNYERELGSFDNSSNYLPNSSGDSDLNVFTRQYPEYDGSYAYIRLEPKIDFQYPDELKINGVKEENLIDLQSGPEYVVFAADINDEPYLLVGNRRLAPYKASSGPIMTDEIPEKFILEIDWPKVLFSTGITRLYGINLFNFAAPRLVEIEFFRVSNDSSRTYEKVPGS